jgi:hypothetical protein
VVLAVGFTVFCVFVECLLNIGGTSGVGLGLLEQKLRGDMADPGYRLFHFFAAINIMLWLKTMKKRVIFITCIYAVAIIMNNIGLEIMGWTY